MARSRKATFALDSATLRRLERTARTLGVAKSRVVREAIAEYSERLGKLGEGERRRLLRAFDELVPRIPPRPAADVDRELAEIRRARRLGGRSRK